VWRKYKLVVLLESSGRGGAGNCVAVVAVQNAFVSAKRRARDCPPYLGGCGSPAPPAKVFLNILPADCPSRELLEKASIRGWLQKQLYQRGLSDYFHRSLVRVLQRKP